MRIPLLLAALATTPALAADKAKPRPGAAAVDPRLMAEFAASDTNKDGVLDRAEVDARVSRMAAGSKRFSPEQQKSLTNLWFARADADRNGKITPFEMQALLRATAARYDTNGDGVVSVAEREAARKAMETETRRR